MLASEPKIKTLQPANNINEVTKLRMDALNCLRQIQFHGANRLAEKESSWYWIPSMLLLFINANVLIWLTITRFRENPTFITQKDTDDQPLAFPAVIICPEIDFQLYKMDEFVSEAQYPERLNKTYIRAVLPQLAAYYAPDVLYKIDDLLNLEEFLMYNGLDVETVGERLTGTCEESLLRCRFSNVLLNCSDMFRMEMTGDGFCCVFNGRSLRRELRERGAGHIKKRTPKIYTTLVGYGTGLMIAVNQTQKPWNIDLSYKWMNLKSAQHFVDTGLNGTVLNPGSEQWVVHQTRSVHIADSVKELSTFLRKCELADQALKYFPIHKRSYCIVECEIANTIKLCGCVRLVHLQPHGVPYCDARQLPCAEHAMIGDSESCNCLPTCDVDTDILTTSSFVLDPTSEPTDHFYSGLKLDNVTIVRVYIKQHQRKIMERFSYYTVYDLFSQLGGMFNLFFGCSILTLLGLIQFVWKITVILGKIMMKMFTKEKNTIHAKR